MDLFTAILYAVLTFLILLTSYKFLTSTENPWKKAGIPTLTKWESLIALISFNIFPMHLGLKRNYKKYGKLFGLHAFGNTILYTADTDLIRLVLAKDFQHFINRLNIVTGDPIFDSMMSSVRDEHWKRIRNATSPAFSTGKIKKMSSCILDCAGTLSKNLEKVAALKHPSDVRKVISAFTMDAIASTAFCTKIDSHNDPNSPFIKVAMKLFGPWGQLKLFLVIIMNSVLRFLHLSSLKIRVFNFFEELTTNMINERRKSGQKRNDFLQVMLDALASNERSAADAVEKNNFAAFSKEENKTDEKSISQNGKSHDENVPTDYKGCLNEDEVLAQCIIFLLGGFETVASTITFAIYELALNEHAQEELISEIDEVLRLNKELTYENVQTMKYLESVVNETLRKYPPGVFTQRIAQEDYRVGDTDLVIPKGTPVVIPVYAMHHDEAFFPNPETFDPNRFSAEEKARRDPYVYLPFGAGPRNCIAMRFALVEVKLCLAYVFSRFRFRRCSKTRVPLKFPALQPQLLAKDIVLIVEKREDAVV